MLNVLMATPSYAPAYRYGGPVRSVEGLAAALMARNVGVRVLTTDANGPVRLNVVRGWTEWNGIPTCYTRRWFKPDLAPEFAWRATLEAQRADVVHVTGLFSVPSMIALTAATAIGRAVVLSPRGALQHEALHVASTSLKRAWLSTWGPMLDRVQLFHATSGQEADAIRKIFPHASVAVVPNGVEPLAFLQLETPQALPIVGALGRISPIKALERLVEAVAELHRRGVACELRIAGPVQDRAYFERLAALIAQHGWDPAPIFLGELRDERKARFLRGCRVMALPSASENFGNVVVEALSAGTPVVASTGTPWQVLEETGSGRWVPNDPTSLADALEPYARDAERAQRAGSLGREYVSRAHGWGRIAAEMEGVYKRALRRG